MQELPVFASILHPLTAPCRRAAFLCHDLLIDVRGEACDGDQALQEFNTQSLCPIHLACLLGACTHIQLLTAVKVYWGILQFSGLPLLSKRCSAGTIVKSSISVNFEFSYFGI